ncbi:transposase domain protein [Leptospira borgpetersenii serovar Hardjo-bovis str. Sponselee]|uniref:Transposase domain protein n=1 Tax=Leptospira borgpetersenii serovar Hardjo-bovis str. Sponselee TaxID=1303729 RepID=M6C069_LEPBO|nr:transposase [Leptospira borgpetersenii serovar Hardjo]AMX61098.1 transposase [Leptospira borgpetersenii serovar Hardjo]AMX67582.1 transposase [Leptospira borgpetersenii serovar Hardjo]EMJ79495.1 transposase domain protein [Leptospira borgpetersenii serovar Hardjo-bovis str. Sponselee]EMJ83091.1 transposase domain protein [Leptospira borgpetersenii serovar Hardjo-bovis str. Sponselee]
MKEQQIKHNEVQIKKFIKKLKTEWNEIHCCYEAGVTGYPLYRYLKSLGVNCILVVPGKIPRQSTDKIKTDRETRSNERDYCEVENWNRFMFPVKRTKQ